MFEYSILCCPILQVGSLLNEIIVDDWCKYFVLVAKYCGRWGVNGTTSKISFLSFLSEINLCMN